MKNCDLEKFMIIMAGMGELYAKEISEALTEIYWKILQRFEWVDVQQAFELHIQDPDCGQFFPKPADIVRAIEGRGESRALEAWSVVEASIGRIGAYETVVFDDPRIHVVVWEMGGWPKLCAVSYEELPFRAREFQKRYQSYLGKKIEAYPASLSGLAATSNAHRGYDSAAPVLIGDPKKAQEVFLRGCAPAFSYTRPERSITKCIPKNFRVIAE